METLSRYVNQDGRRAVALTVIEGSERPYALSDRPQDDRWAGTHFFLGSYATREEAQEAAERHADACACAVDGTYEVWHGYLATGL